MKMEIKYQKLKSKAHTTPQIVTTRFHRLTQDSPTTPNIFLFLNNKISI